MKSAATIIAIFALAAVVHTQTPPPTRQGGPPATTPAPAGQPQGGRGGVRPPPFMIMTLSTPAWIDGGLIPLKYTQAGAEVSPPLTWSEPPEAAKSFTLIVHDIDATNGDGTADRLHWMVWNIPADLRNLPEHIEQGGELGNGFRQISVTGPYYRGPAAPATDPAHHYVFDLYALDTTIDVKAVGATVVQTRAAVVAAMAGHVRGKGSLTGRFRYAAVKAPVKK